MRRRTERGEHQVLAILGALAAVATILTFLIQVGILAWPFTGGGGQEGDPGQPLPCASPALSLSRGSGPSGTHVDVSGSGFPSDASVDVRFHTEALPPARTGADGTFAVEIVIPGTFDAFAGQQFMITATTSPTICSMSAPFKLTG